MSDWDCLQHPSTDLFWNKIIFVTVNIILQSIPFKNAVDVASNGERFTLTNAANLKTYVPSKINKKKSHKGTYTSGILITKL
jgi:hypothetical protein